MTEDEKFYLAVEALAFESIATSGMANLAQIAGARGVLYLFDPSYAMGFAACQKMLQDGVDVSKLDPKTLSLLPPPGHESSPAE